MRLWFLHIFFKVKSLDFMQRTIFTHKFMFRKGLFLLSLVILINTAPGTALDSIADQFRFHP